MSIKKILFGTTASLLLASGFATTASASENDNIPTEEITEGNGIKVPLDMEVGDTYEEIIDIDGRDFTYNVTKVEEETKDDEQADNVNATDFSVMNDPVTNGPITVDITESASYTVRGGFGALFISFLVETDDGLITNVAPGSYAFGVGVDFADLTLHDSRFASYDFGLSADVDWIGGPTAGVGLRARMVSPGGAMPLINYLEMELY